MSGILKNIKRAKEREIVIQREREREEIREG